MAEFQVIIKQAARMCKANNGKCHKCPAYGSKYHCCLIWPEAIAYRSSTPEQVEQIVMDWAEEHPEPRYPTWDEWFKATFPNSGYHTMPCPNVFYKICEAGKYHSEVECYECKNRPIPADIAEKLRVKPIGGADNENA